MERYREAWVAFATAGREGHPWLQHEEALRAALSAFLSDEVVERVAEILVRCERGEALSSKRPVGSQAMENYSPKARAAPQDAIEQVGGDQGE